MKKRGQTAFQVNGYGEEDHKRKGMYIVIALVVAILALGGFIYFYFFNASCHGNPLFTEVQLSAIKRTAADVDIFCAVETNQGSCGAKTYFVYTTDADVDDTQRTWSYSDTRVDPASGMRYWGTIENACVWK